MELAIYHPIMDNQELVSSITKKVHQKRGGNLCAPVPRGIGGCGYINELTNEKCYKTLTEYKAICLKYPRDGHGIDMHLHDVGLDDTSVVSGEALKGLTDQNTGSTAKSTKPDANTYNEWIKSTQFNRNANWQLNVLETPAENTINPPKCVHYTLFNEGIEEYAVYNSSLVSNDIRNIASSTVKSDLFAPCMVGSLEAQFLKMLCSFGKAKSVLDIGTFTGMSALAFAEALPNDGKVITLECDERVAQVAKDFIQNSASNQKIDLIMGKAADSMRQLKSQGVTFDIIFIDADKES